MAEFKHKMSDMKREVNKITGKIDLNLYQKILTVVSAPPNTIEDYETAMHYFLDQLLKNKFDPYNMARILREFDYTQIAIELEEFAKTFNFVSKDPSSDISSNKPEDQILALFKTLKAQLTKSELLLMRESDVKSFEDIFRDLLKIGKFTPDFEDLKMQLQDINREDLASAVVECSKHTSTMTNTQFLRTARMCLDTIDSNIFSLLENLKEALLKQHCDFHSLDEETETSKLRKDFIGLTFTKEVDTRTLPLTEGSDAELKTLMENYKQKESEKTSNYVDAMSQIYSPELNGKLVAIIGHPGTGKTVFCRKLINQYATSENTTYRFVLFIACRNSQLHILEEKFLSNISKEADRLKQFLQIILPAISKQDELITLILESEGNGLLLIIDSFDEFPQYDRFDATLLYQLLARRVLTKCTLLITSRPGAWNQLLRGYGREFKFNQSWQVLGFSVQQRDTFIQNMLTTDKVDTLQQILSTKPEINLLTLVPVNISLICTLVQHSVSLSDISTLTEVYTRLVLFTLDRQLKRLDKHSPGIHNFKEMPKDMKSELNALSTLAYKGLKERQITFSASKMTNIMKSKSKYSKGLGLFQIIKVTSKQQTVIDYLSCPHLTLQEYLSAWHLSRKSTKQIIKKIQKIFSTDTWPAMKVCIRFVCGLISEGQRNIINTITSQLHIMSAPLPACEYFYFDGRYTLLHMHITANHLSIIPYILETAQSDILTDYYKHLTPITSSMPHFYLYENVSPVDLYSLCECFTKLPAHCSITTLLINITLLDSLQLLMLAQAINSIQIDKLIIILHGTDEARDISAIEQLPNSIADISYELQNLHTSMHNTLLNEFHQLATSLATSNIYKLKYILLTANLSVTGLTLHSDIQLYTKLCTFINNISNLSSSHCLPKQIYYWFVDVEFMEEATNKQLLNILASTATCVSLFNCYYPIQFSRNIISQPKLAYLHTQQDKIDYLEELNNQLLAPDILVMNVDKQNFKGLTLDCTSALSEYTICNFLSNQHSLEEIQILRTRNPLQVFTSIQHLSTLKYLKIQSRYVTPPDKELCQAAFIDTLTRNCHTLSHVSIYPDCVISHAWITDLSRFINLQSIQFSSSLTLQLMAPIASVINQLHSLLYLHMFYCAITDEGVAILSQILIPNSNIRSIMLYRCSLTASSLPAITILLTKCKHLQYLDLEDNSIEDNTEELHALCEKRNIKLDI